MARGVAAVAGGALLTRGVAAVAGCTVRAGRGRIVGIGRDDTIFAKSAGIVQFREGRRGRHESDVYGAQMLAFASMLPDDVAIRNVSAYIESLQGHEGEASERNLARVWRVVLPVRLPDGLRIRLGDQEGGLC